MTDACSLAFNAISVCTAEQRSNTMFVMGFLEATMVTLRELGELTGRTVSLRDQRRTLSDSLSYDDDYSRPLITHEVPYYEDELRHIVSSVLSQCPGVTFASDDDCTKYIAFRESIEKSYDSIPGYAAWCSCPDDPEVQRVEIMNQPIKTQMNELATSHRSTIHVNCILDHATWRDEVRDEYHTRCPMYFPSDMYHRDHISKIPIYIEGYKVALHMTYRSFEPSCRPIFMRPLLTEPIQDKYTINAYHKDEPRNEFYKIGYMQQNGTRDRLAFIAGNGDILASMEVDVKFTSECSSINFKRIGDDTQFAWFFSDAGGNSGRGINRSFWSDKEMCLQILLDIAAQYRTDPDSHFIATKRGVTLVNGCGDDVYSFITEVNNECYNCGYSTPQIYVDAVLTNRAGSNQVMDILYVKTNHDKYKYIHDEEHYKLHQERVAICEAICSPERKALMASIVTSSGTAS